MEKAIHDWSKKEGDIYDNNGEMINDWKVFANRLGIPVTTFYDDQDGKKYTHDTGLIDANVMDNDKSEDNELVVVRSTRQKTNLPARFKECYF
jgi:hypothetical protein